MFVHSHPPNLRGTKFFQWGKDLSGQFMQDFMSASNYESDKCTAPYYDPWCEEYDHEGDYTELQVGPAPTQMHTFPVPAKSTYEWSEWFKGYQASQAVVPKVHTCTLYMFIHTTTNIIIFTLTTYEYVQFLQCTLKQFI